MEGRTLERLEVLDARWCEPARARRDGRRGAGRRVERLSRRGKYLIGELEDEVHLVMHLRMTGNLLVVPADEDVDERPHLRARLVFDSGERVLFVDVRRFGTGIVLLGDDALRRLLLLAPRRGAAQPGLHRRRPARARRRPARAR